MAPITGGNNTITITARCERGHEQSISVSAELGLAWAQQQAAMLDGTSSFYVHSPIGTDSVIGKCGICGTQITCRVEEDAA